MPAQFPSINDLKMWFKADSISANDGDAIGSWSDSSGSGLVATQSNQSLKPIFKTNQKNGKPSLRFLNSSLSVAYNASKFPVANNLTMFVVYKHSGASGYQPVVTQPASSGWGNPYVAYMLRVDNSVPTLYWGNSSNAFSAIGSSNLQQQAAITAITRNLSSSAYTIYGTDRSVKATGTSVIGNTYASTESLLFGTNPGNEWFNGDIFEIIIYDRVLTASERNSVHLYLEDKYGFPSPAYATPLAPGSQFTRSFRANTMESSGVLPFGSTLNGSWTFETWVNKRDSNQDDRLITWQEGGDNHFCLDLVRWGGGHRIRILAYNTPIIFDKIMEPVVSADNDVNNGWFRTGEWYHLAIVKDGGTLKVYVDGVLKLSTAISYSLDGNSRKLSFFNSNCKYTEVRFWDAARSGSEIANNYQKEVSASSSNLLMLYRFTNYDVPLSLNWVNFIEDNLASGGLAYDMKFHTIPAGWGGPNNEGRPTIEAVTDHPYPMAPNAGGGGGGGGGGLGLISKESASVARAQVLNMTLDKSALATASGVSQAQWKRVLALYTAPGKPKAVVSFKHSQESASGRFRSKAGSSASYTLSKVIIVKTDSTYKIVDRSELSSPESSDVEVT